MARLLHCVVLITSLLLSTGCAVKNIKAGEATDSSKALFVGSITYDGMLSAYKIYFRPVGQEKGVDFVQTGSDSVFKPSAYARQDFEALGMKGDVFAVELPPGEYEVISWGVVGGPVRVGPGEPFSMPYTLRAGETTYAGNFHFTQTDRRGLAVTGVRVGFSKPLERDLAILREKYPGLRIEPVDAYNPNRPTAIVGSGSSTDVMTPPVYLPPK